MVRYFLRLPFINFPVSSKTISSHRGVSRGDLNRPFQLTFDPHPVKDRPRIVYSCVIADLQLPRFPANFHLCEMRAVRGPIRAIGMRTANLRRELANLIDNWRSSFRVTCLPESR